MVVGVQVRDDLVAIVELSGAVVGCVVHRGLCVCVVGKREYTI